MAFVTGTNFVIDIQTGFVTGTNFTVTGGDTEHNYSQVSTAILTTIGGDILVDDGGYNNTSVVTSGTLTFIGLDVSCEALDHSYSQLSEGTVTFIAEVPQVAVANLLAVDAYTVTIQGTQDLYYLSDSMSGFAVDYYPFHESDISKDLTGLVLITNNIRTTQTRSILNPATIDLSYLRDYYYRIHISIINLDLGNVLSEQIFYVEVWNAWFVSDTLSSIVDNQLSDITLTVPWSIPHVFKPLENAILEINVTPTGTPVINGDYTFTFSTETLILYVTGKRVILWPFAPTTTFNETRSYITDILPSRLNETRYTLRETPRVILEYKFNFKTSEQYALAHRMAKTLAHLALAVPLWTDITFLLGITAGDTVITFPTKDLELAPGTVVVFWTSFKDYELGEVLTVTSTNITLTKPLLYNHSACWVVPVVIGYADGGIPLTENENFGRTGSLKITAVDTYNNPVWANPTMFQSLPVLTATPVVSGGIASKYSRESATLDSILGFYNKFDDESYNRLDKSIAFYGLSKTELYNLRRFFDYLKGKYTAFWLPSFTEDIVALAPAVNASTSLHVRNDNLYIYQPKYIKIVGENTQMFEVTSVSDNLDGTAYLTLLTPISPAINNIQRIEIMTKVRLDSDNIEFAHKGKNVHSVKVPVTEILA